MSIFVSHWSALHLYTLARQGLIAPIEPSSIHSLDTACAHVGPVKESGVLDYISSDRPVDIMVSDRAAAYSGARTHAHLMEKPLIPGTIYRLGNFYVASPELALIQVATTLKFTDLILLLMEFAGTYTTFPAYAAYGSSAVCELQSVRGVASQLLSMRGAKPLLRALSYALPGAASPMESVAALMLSLPLRYGGYGLPQPQLNASIGLNKRARVIAEKTICYCDLFWEQGAYALEYDSREFHEGVYHHGQDTKRALALESMGITVQPITYLQLTDEIQLDEIAQRIARAAGCRLRQGTAKTLYRRRDLLENLLHPHLYDAFA